MKYPQIEKLALAVVMTAKKLKHYFQAHPIAVRTDQPLRKALQRPETSRRLVQRSVELGEHDIRYEPKTALEAQVLADFVMEMAGSTEVPQVERTATAWTLHVDGSQNETGAGIGVILQGPSLIKMEYAARLSFPATNNVAEYEALLAGLRFAVEVKAESLTIHSDSQLVVEQVVGGFKAKDDVMARYLLKVKHLLNKLENLGGVDHHAS